MILYFSVTGSSKYVASRIKESFPSYETVDVFQAQHENEISYEVEDDEIVFLIFPIYYFNIPKQVRSFMENVKIRCKSQKVKVCAIVTCASTVGSVDAQLRKLLKPSDMELVGCYTVKMPSFYVPLKKTMLIEEQKMILKRADYEISNIIEAVNYKFRKPYHAGLIQRMYSFIGRIIYKNGRPTKKFHVSDSCISCGQCEKYCIDGILKLKFGEKPVWTAGRCSHCMGCLQNCPKKAIRYGDREPAEYIYLKRGHNGKRI